MNFSLNEKKISLLYNGGILRQWYFILIIVCFAFVFWQINPLAFLLWLFSPFFIFSKKDEDKIIGGLAVLSLGFCILFLVLIQDKFAEISAVFTFYFLVLFLVQRLVQVRKDPTSFDLALFNATVVPNIAVETEPILSDAKSSDVIARPLISVKKNHTSVTLANATVIALYLLIFGASWPNSQNYGRFILLAIILFIVNSIVTLKNIVAKFFDYILRKYGVDQKNALLVGLINLSIIASYLLLFGLSLPNQFNYHRFIVLFFILFIMNSIIFFDIANDQYSD